MKMEVWSGKVRSGNLGPARGDRLLGEVAGPGLYMFVGNNATGKSSLLRVLSAMRDQKALGSVANVITDGEMQAYLELEPVRVVFRRSPMGEASAKLEGEAELPEISELPPSIEVLIHGDHLKDPEARARRRLSALLSYAPVLVTPKLAGELFLCLEERAFTDPNAGLPDVANERPKDGLVATAAELREEVLARKPNGLLEAHDVLVGLLHRCARTFETAAKGADKNVARVRGRRDEALADAKRSYGMEETAMLRALRSEYEHEKLGSAVEAARERFAAISSAREAHRAAQERRDKLRAAHGTRPEMDSQAALEALAKARQCWLSLIECASGNDGMLDECTGKETLAFGVDLEAEQEQLFAAVRNLRAALDDRDVRAAQARWDEVERELNEPLGGPEEAEVQQAADELSNAKQMRSLAGSAQRFRSIEEELEAAVNYVAKLSEIAEDYRKSAKDSWRYLGAAVTAELRLPWLQVDGLEIFLGYVGGKLNSDPELITRAERAVVAAMNDDLSPVSLRRFLLGRVREASEIDWRPIDSEERVSTGELHNACLEVMLSRRESLGGILIVPWGVTAALDGSGLRKLSKKLKSAGIIGFGERPRRDGDKEGLMMEAV